MLTSDETTVEKLLDKFGTPVSWFREGRADEKREQFVLSMLKQKFPGKYVLEEYFNPDKGRFMYRLKFDTEADEMWFKLRYQ